jgi:RNA recognition motif-containing protein
VRDPVTGSSRGFGFVTYYKDSIAKKLISEI